MVTMKNIFSFSLLFILISCNDESQKVTSKKTVPKTQTASLEKKSTEKIVASKKENFNAYLAVKSGRIEKLYIRENQKVARNQLLFRYENKKAFEAIALLKERFKKQVSDSLQLHNELDRVASKWFNFEQSILSSDVLPAFPKIQFQEEARVFYSEEIKENYSKIKKAEENMLLYFHKSQKKLMVKKVYVRNRSFVKKNDTIFTYKE